MAKHYQIGTPDGKTITVEGPDDATDDELIQFARTQVGGEYQQNPVSVLQDQAAEQQRLEARPTSQTQGFVEGVADVWNNAADYLEELPGMGAVNQFGADYLGMAPNADAARQNQQAELNASPNQSGEIGKFAGNVAATLPLSALPGGVFAQGAAGGALLSEAKDATGIGTDALIGGVGGKVGDLALRGAARLIAPRFSRDVQTLVQEGVEPTSGQIAASVNPGETASMAARSAKKVEDVAATLPVAGAGVQNAQYRGTTSLNRAAANRALRPIGERLPRNVAEGQESIAFAGDRLSQAYNDVLPRLNGQLDRTFETRINAIANRANLPPEYANQLQQARDELGNAFQRTGRGNGVFTGRTLRDASERLSDISTAWRRSDDPYLRIAGDVTEQYRQQLHALARRQNPADSQRLRDIDRGYASLVRLERAAAGTSDGIVTPRQYDAAVRGSDPSARRRQSARGRALDQDLSGAAVRVMANNAAQGGSKDVNSLVALGVLGSSAVGGNPLAMAGLGGVVGGSAAYSPAGQAALRTLMTRQSGPTQASIAQLLRLGAQGAPIVTPALIQSRSNGAP